ncbi:MAG: hypothetical protein K2X77_00920 [Candidatus Obscuribacterales bacterium]|nr:hypothetical protein [Candidatus Obscuribacterales bacterium]
MEDALKCLGEKLTARMSLPDRANALAEEAASDLCKKGDESACSELADVQQRNQKLVQKYLPHCK